MTANIIVPAATRSGSSTAVRRNSVARAAVEASAAISRPVDILATTRAGAGRPAGTRRRSADLAWPTWKNIASAARNAAAQPVVAVSTARPVPPSSFAASAIGSAATHTNTTGIRIRTTRFTGLRP